MLGVALFMSSAAGLATPVQWVELPNAGIDSDYDGVRDDVAAEIRKRYTQVRERRWPMEIARAGQRHVTSDGNPFAIYRAQAEMQRAIRCITKSNNQAVAESVRDEILELVLNTKSRRLAYSSSIALWEDDIRHRELPARPDDRWQESCGNSYPLTHVVRVQTRADDSAQAATVQERAAPAIETAPLTSSYEMEVEAMEALPPPNFFLTQSEPASTATVVDPAETDLQDEPEPISDGGDMGTLPEAFVVKPEIQPADRLSAAFRVGGSMQARRPSRKSRRTRPVVVESASPLEPPAIAVAEENLPSKTDTPSAQPAMMQVNRLTESALAPEAAEVAQEAETITEPQVPESQQEIQTVVVIEDQAAEVEPELPEPAPTVTAVDESDSDDELVVVVKKGKEGSSSVVLTPLGEEQEMPVENAMKAVLPPALLELAPFIKSFEYQ